MKNSDWKDRLNVVYSTNPDYNYEMDDDEEQVTLEPSQQNLRLSVYAESGTRTFAYKVNGSGTCLHFAGPVSSGICFPLSSYCFCFRISFFLQQFYYFLFEVSLNDNLSVFS